MLSSQVLSGLKGSVRGAIHSRNIGILAPCLQKATDPIQQLFVDKIKEYGQKSAGYELFFSTFLTTYTNTAYRGSKLVDPSPGIQRELKSELEKLVKNYGGEKSEDMVKFPSLKFTEPTLDPINLEK